MSSGDARFYAEEETKITAAVAVTVPADTEDAHSDVSGEGVSSRASGS